MNLKHLMIAALGSLTVLNAAERPALPEFDPEDVLADFTAEELVNKYSRIVEDPEAVSGKALVRTAPPVTLNEGIAFRIGDKKTKRYDPVSGIIPPEAVPSDGKFHWYNLGTLRQSLTKDTILHMHKGGYGPTKDFGDANVPETIFGQPVAIWISLKLSGPVYTERKDVPNRYAIDRVVIVKGTPLKRHPKLSPVPTELKTKKICYELSGTSLNAFLKIPDKKSVVGCALSSNGVLKIGIYGIGTQKNRIYEGKVATDGEYHLYKIGPFHLSPTAKLSVGTYGIPLGQYWNESDKLKSYEIWVSSRNEGANRAMIDRIFLVDAEN